MLKRKNQTKKANRKKVIRSLNFLHTSHTDVLWFDYCCYFGIASKFVLSFTQKKKAAANTTSSSLLTQLPKHFHYVLYSRPRPFYFHSLNYRDKLRWENTTTYLNTRAKNQNESIFVYDRLRKKIVNERFLCLCIKVMRKEWFKITFID